jgi:hypothetical protein
MAAQVPLWRSAFDTIEAAVGRPLEQAVGDPRFMRALIVGLEISNAVDRHGAKRLVPGLTSRQHPRPLRREADLAPPGRDREPAGRQDLCAGDSRMDRASLAEVER